MGTTSLQDVKTGKFWAALAAEFLGTMFLVLVGCGSTTTVGGTSNVVRIALCFGLSVATLVWAIAGVSGGHINPAVTFGFMVTRKISLIRWLLYTVVQMLGAIVGSGLLMALTPAVNRGTLGTCAPSDDVMAGPAFGVELLITFVLVFTVFSSVDGGRRDLQGSAPLTIGLSIAMCHLWAVPYTGAGMNPARVFGPAVVSGTWKIHWVYWIAPLIGGAVAAWLYDFVFAVNATPAKIRAFFTRDYDEDRFDGKGSRVSDSEVAMK